MPRVADGVTSVWAQYTIRLLDGRRDALAATLKADGVPTAVYYPMPLHQQTAYRGYAGRRRRRAAGPSGWRRKC